MTFVNFKYDISAGKQMTLPISRQNSGQKPHDI